MPWARRSRRLANSWRENTGADELMISPRENQEAYQAALAWVARQVEAAERQGLTLDYLGGSQTFQPDQKDLERAWRVLVGIPEMTHLLTPPAWQWEQVLLRSLRHHHLSSLAGLPR